MESEIREEIQREIDRVFRFLRNAVNKSIVHTMFIINRPHHSVAIDHSAKIGIFVTSLRSEMKALASSDIETVDHLICNIRYSLAKTNEWSDIGVLKNHFTLSYGNYGMSTKYASLYDFNVMTQNAVNAGNFDSQQERDIQSSFHNLRMIIANMGMVVDQAANINKQSDVLVEQMVKVAEGMSPSV